MPTATTRTTKMTTETTITTTVKIITTTTTTTTTRRDVTPRLQASPPPTHSAEVGPGSVDQLINWLLLICYLISWLVFGWLWWPRSRRWSPDLGRQAPPLCPPHPPAHWGENWHTRHHHLMLMTFTRSRFLVIMTTIMTMMRCFSQAILGLGDVWISQQAGPPSIW